MMKGKEKKEDPKKTTTTSSNSTSISSNKRVKFDVPAGLKDVLINFTVSVLINKPHNLVEYGARYFDRLNREQKEEALQDRYEPSKNKDDEEAQEKEDKQPTLTPR